LKLSFSHLILQSKGLVNLISQSRNLPNAVAGLAMNKLKNTRVI
jgi:hypothetical protein